MTHEEHQQRSDRMYERLDEYDRSNRVADIDAVSSKFLCGSCGRYSEAAEWRRGEWSCLPCSGIVSRSKR